MCFLRMTAIMRNTTKPMMLVRTQVRTEMGPTALIVSLLRALRSIVAQRGVHTPHS